MGESFVNNNVAWEVIMLDITHQCRDRDIISRLFNNIKGQTNFSLNCGGVDRINKILHCDEAFCELAGCCLFEIIYVCEAFCQSGLKGEKIIDEFVALFDNMPLNYDNVTDNKHLLRLSSYVRRLNGVYREHDERYANFIDRIMAGILLGENGYDFCCDVNEKYVYIFYIFLDVLNTMFIAAKEKFEKIID